MNKENIVIVGGGFAGTSAAKVLVRSKTITDSYNVILINKNDYLLFTPNLYEMAVDEKTKFEITVKLKNVFLFNPVQIIEDEVKFIDNENNCVFLNSGKKIDFKYLIVAVGSSINDYGIKGIQDYAYFLKTAEDADKLSEALENLFQKYSEQNQTVDIVIGGAGYTGVEIGSEIANHAHEILRKYDLDLSKLHISMINPSDKMLKTINNEAGNIAKERLTNLGVQIIENEKVTDISKNQVILSDGKMIHYDIFIWTGGVKGNETIEKSQFSKTEYNISDRLITDKFMRVKDYNNIFACGDSSCIEGANVPMMAQIAIEEGKIAAKNIIATIKNKSLKESKIKLDGQIVPMAGDYSYGIILGHIVKGRVASFISKLIYLRFLLQVLPPGRAFIKWFIYLF